MSTSISTNPMAAFTLATSGIAITSTSTPALNGSYRTDGIFMLGLQAEINAVALDGTFADGTATLNWPDAKGAAHTFTVAQFKTLAMAIANFQAQCAQYAAGLIATAPSSSVTIA